VKLRKWLEREILTNQSMAVDTSLRPQTRSAALVAWQVIEELLTELESRQAPCLEAEAGE